jgi:SAM-dependent methyltransferase
MIEFAPADRGDSSTGKHRDERMALLWVRPFAAWLDSSGLLNPEAAVLDYGCGYLDLGLLVAGRVGRVDGYEPWEPALRRCRERIGGVAGVSVTDSPDALPGDYDLILVNSVLQYMSPDGEIAEFLFRARRLLKHDGTLVIADIVPPDYPAALDALENLIHAMRHGSGPAMIRHLWNAATQRGGSRLTRLSRSDLARLAEEQDFDVEILQRNLTPSRRRYTALLRPKGR